MLLNKGFLVLPALMAAPLERDLSREGTDATAVIFGLDLSSASFDIMSKRVFDFTGFSGGGDDADKGPRELCCCRGDV